VTPNRVRIIGGLYRSRILRFPPRPELRPTPDRVRETVFNWLGQDLTGLACLDLFAGSGALGFEAASRGAARVVLVEKDAHAFEALRANAALLGAAALRPVRSDALEFVRSCTETFDVIFLDPPFRRLAVETVLAAIATLAKPGGRVYAESAHGVDPGAPWSIERSARAGQVVYQVLRHDRE